MDRYAIQTAVISHLDVFWRRHEKALLRVDAHEDGVAERFPSLRVVRVHPGNPLDPWVYVTLGNWELTAAGGAGAEIMLITNHQLDAVHLDTLCRAVALGHAAGGLGPGTLIDLGRPWMDGSRCTQLLVTRPYPYGPQLEEADVDGIDVKVLWLLPITVAERRLAETEGLEALERRFDEVALAFMDPERACAVEGV